MKLVKKQKKQKEKVIYRGKEIDGREEGEPEMEKWCSEASINNACNWETQAWFWVSQRSDQIEFQKTISVQMGSDYVVDGQKQSS